MWNRAFLPSESRDGRPLLSKSASKGVHKQIFTAEAVALALALREEGLSLPGHPDSEPGGLPEARFAFCFRHPRERGGSLPCNCMPT